MVRITAPAICDGIDVSDAPRLRLSTAHALSSVDRLPAAVGASGKVEVGILTLTCSKRGYTDLSPITLPGHRLNLCESIFESTRIRIVAIARPSIPRNTPVTQRKGIADAPEVPAAERRRGVCESGGHRMNVEGVGSQDRSDRLRSQQGTGWPVHSAAGVSCWHSRLRWRRPAISRELAG